MIPPRLYPTECAAGLNGVYERVPALLNNGRVCGRVQKTVIDAPSYSVHESGRTAGFRFRIIRCIGEAGGPVSVRSLQGSKRGSHVL